MSSQPLPHVTVDEYLTIERDCKRKHEYFRGEMFAMAGASAAHNQITFNLARLLGNQLADRDCKAYVNDMRVKVSDTELYTYPDGIVTCEDPHFEDEHVDTLLNPQVLIEVLSDSTEKYDRGKKFELYREMESLRDYILISQDHAHIERFARDERGNWYLVDATGLDAAMELPSVDCTLPLADVFAKVDFPPEEPRDQVG